MQIIRKYGYARAGLVGNPSDGFSGKTISFLIRDFFAKVILYEWEETELILSQEDQCRFGSIHELVRDVELHGYYGGVRLVKATIKRFYEFCARRRADGVDGFTLHDRNFAIRYESNIPRQVGLAGSSAIIVATLNALMEFYDVTIPIAVQPSLVLSVEAEELGIPAGLQDRVIQVYGGLVYMDFSQEATYEQFGFRCGVYHRLDAALLPPLYIAFTAEVSEPTETLHNPLRARFNEGDEAVVSAMKTFASYARDACDAIRQRDADKLALLINANFDQRAKICNLLPEHVKMVETARSVGASAKFAGSGGAIVGTYHDAAMFCELKRKLAALGCTTIIPTIATHDADSSTD